MRKFYIPLLILLLVSCRKEIETIIEFQEKQYSWKEDSRFDYDKGILYNSHCSENALYLMGLYYYTEIALPGTLLSYWKMPYAHIQNTFNYPTENKLPITDNFYIGVSKEYNVLVFVPNDIALYNENSKLLFIDKIDSTFSQFDFIPYSMGECIAVTKDNYCLVPYIAHEPDQTTKILLIKLRVGLDHDNSIAIDTSYTKVLDNPLKGITGGGGQYVAAISDLKDGFLVTFGTKTFKIDTLGNSFKVFNGIIHPIKTKNSLIGIGHSIDLMSPCYLKSNDNGLDWDIISTTNAPLGQFRYKTVYDTIIGYSASQLFKFHFSDTLIQATEINNDGIENKLITSISEFADSLVYVTTLNGAFYKNKKDFFTKKVTIDE